MRLVLDPERVVEALELRDPHVQRHLAALEADRDGAAGLLALGAAAGGLAALAADAAADAASALGSSPARASDRGLFMTHLLDVASTVTRCGTRAIMPRISGRSGRVFDLPMPPQAEGAQRAAVLGLRADAPTGSG